MKTTLLLTILAVFSFTLRAEIIFEDNFEKYANNRNLTSEGYILKQSSSYTGTVKATVSEDSGNKLAKCIADPNGPAQMQIRKTISVTPGTLYIFEASTISPFKRSLKVFNAGDGTVIATSPDIMPAAGKETDWIQNSVSFVPGAGVTSVQIAVFHNWSGTLCVDNIKVYTTSSQTSYYLSSSMGNDNNDGTINAPWKTLAKITATALLPGNTVFFKRGDRFDGHFVVNGSGSKEAPIRITAYSTGAKPIITGEVGKAAGGDYQEAIYVENNDNMIFDGLEINNERLFNRNGVNEKDAYGVQIHNTGNKIMRNFVFRNMTFKNVYAVKPILSKPDFDGLEVAGLRFMSNKNKVAGKAKNIENILVEKCYFTDLQRLGIHFKHNGGNNGVGNDALNRNQNIICRNNEFSYLGGTSILPQLTYNCLIENNLFDHPGASTDARMPARGSSVWTFHCINTVIQYNKCLSTRGYFDSHGIHIDHKNVNTFIQYNYMEDCEGGFVEILKGNKNAVYRFNVSVNDGWRNGGGINGAWANSNHTLWISSGTNNQPDAEISYCDGTYIYNNTVIMDYNNYNDPNKKESTAIDLNGKNTFVYNNIFYSVNGGEMGAQQVYLNANNTELLVKNNLFYGNIASAFVNADASPVKANPNFTGNGTQKNKFQLNATSPAINAGLAKKGPAIPGAGVGIFKDVPAYPVVDFYGNPINLSSGKPNIGACNIKSKKDVSLSQKFPGSMQLNIFPNPVKSEIHLTFTEAIKGKVFISLLNIKGQIVQTQEKKLTSNTERFVVQVASELPNGQYLINIKTEDLSLTRQVILVR